jgi:hypothetical protein
MLSVATDLNRLSDFAALSVYPPPPQMPRAASRVVSTPAKPAMKSAMPWMSSVRKKGLSTLRGSPSLWPW